MNQIQQTTNVGSQGFKINFQLEQQKNKNYFVNNIISNESIISANSLTPRNTTSKNMNSKKQNIKYNSNKQKQSSPLKNNLCVLRSYGSTGFNYKDCVQLNNRCSIKDNAITSDILLKNEQRRKQILIQQSHRQKQQRQKLKKEAVNVNEYKNYLKTEQISDAYYFVNEEIMKAKKRQNDKMETIKRVKSLSRSKSKEQGLQFRKKQQQNINCINKIQQLKQKYTQIIVPEIMGIQNQILSNRNKSLTSMKKISTTISLKPLKLSKKSQQFNINQSQQPNKNKNFKIVQSRLQNCQQYTPSIQNSYIQQNYKQKSSPSTDYLQSYNVHSKQLINLQSKQSFNSKDNGNAKSTINKSNSMLDLLQKCKSSEDFINKQRVKVIKQAFIQNWKQGQFKKHPKSQEIYPCDYTQKLKNQKQKIKQENIKQKKQLMYGQNALKKNLIQNVCNNQSQNTYMQRYDTLKQYQLQFSQIAKNSIKSCVISKK